MQDAAGPNLEGDVSPGTTGGCIRYRLWPARRHPVRAILLSALCVLATWGVWGEFHSVLYAAFAFVGTVTGVALFLFPTEVSLDGHQLNMRALGTPRTWDLRQFRRLEVSGKPLAHVELLKRQRLGALDKVAGVTIPLPADAEAAHEVTMHLRRWVGRQVTGRFEIDADHAPEDTVPADDG